MTALVKTKALIDIGRKMIGACFMTTLDYLSGNELRV